LIQRYCSADLSEFLTPANGNCNSRSGLQKWPFSDERAANAARLFAAHAHQLGYFANAIH